jgi:nucleoside-diphosphate-sugar epimerase
MYHDMLLKVAAVTGARGLIGRHIIDCLLAEGWCVRVLSRKPVGMLEHPNLELIVADINDEKALGAFLAGVSAVFHCAAELNDESRMHDVNVLGTACLLNVLSSMTTAKYFCFLSSAGVMGPTAIAKVDEMAPCFPNNTYERTKHEAEALVLQASLRMRVCILRPANVFDVNKLGILKAVLESSPKGLISLFVKGNEGAHLVHAKDVAFAALFFMDKELLQPEVFFVSYDDDPRNTVQGVYKFCRDVQGSKPFVFSFSLPSVVPYLMRSFFKGRSLHGRARFSEDKLKQSGFKFPLGFENALRDVCSSHKGGPS